MILEEPSPFMIDNPISSVVNSSNDSSKKKIDSLYLRKIGGFDLISQRPFVTKDKCLFVISGHNIRKYLLENGNFIDEYHFGVEKNIVSIEQNENFDEVLIVFENGQIVQWNYVENFKINNYQINIKDYPERKISFCQKIDSVYYFIIETKTNKKNKPKCQLYHCSLDQLNPIPINQDHLYSRITSKSIAFGPSSKVEYCAVISKHLLYVYRIPINKNDNDDNIHFITTKKHFRCVAFHPFEPIIATGDIIGQIFIWNDIQSLKPAKSILHWHSQSVSDLAFAPSGTNLYSVGAEMVLVKWNLVGGNFGQQSFLPRLGSKLKYVTVDPENKFIVTSQLDQSLTIIDTQMNGIRCVIQGLSIGHGQNQKLTAGLHYNCRLKALALNGRVGHVQFYCPDRQQLLFQFDVTNQNIVNDMKMNINTRNILKMIKEKKDDIQTFFPIEVSKMALSEDGVWMATVEYRDDHETSPEIRLKFWEMKKENNGFRLNTTVHLPHLEEIIHIQFSPQKDDKTFNMVTTSKDKTFKIWDLNTNETNKWWNCSRNGSLSNQTIPTMASFSNDASLISVLFDNIVTLWELESPTSIRYIPRMDIFKKVEHDWPIKPKAIIFISFAYGKWSHYLIEGYRDSIIVRNVVKKFETVFTYEPKKTRINSITLNHHEGILAIFSFDSINFLCLSDQQIIAKIDLTKMKNLDNSWISSIFCSKNDFGAGFRKNFYCINSKNELFQAIHSTSDKPFDHNSAAVLVSWPKEKRTELFIKHVDNQVAPLSFLAKSVSASNRKEKGMDCEKVAKSIVEKLFYDVPAHVLPSVDIIEKSFLTSYFECLKMSNPANSSVENKKDDKMTDTMDDRENRRKKSITSIMVDENRPSIKGDDEDGGFLEKLFQTKQNFNVQNQGIVKENEFYWLGKCFDSGFQSLDG